MKSRSCAFCERSANIGDDIELVIPYDGLTFMMCLATIIIDHSEAICMN